MHQLCSVKYMGWFNEPLCEQQGPSQCHLPQPEQSTQLRLEYQIWARRWSFRLNETLYSFSEHETP